MAFNRQTFRTRTLTAAVFVIVMLAGLLINHWTFFLLFTIIHFGCWMEYQKLVGLIDKDYQQITAFHKYGVMLAGWCIMLYFTNDAYTLFGVRLHELGWWLGLLFVFILPITELLFTRNIQLKNIGYSAAGLIYISLSLGLMIDLRSVWLDYVAGKGIWDDAGIVIPLIIIAALWINDTMAYLIGSMIGKTPLSPISPKKTWEGTIGGLILCVGILGGYAFWHGEWRQQIFPVDMLIIAAITASAGIFGDLLESKLKRAAGVKDSGSIMPGHGGFLDRFDSMLLAIPFVWIYVALFM